MKRLKPPSSILQVARLSCPTKEGVKKEVLKLAQASPPFSYDDLYKMLWDLVRKTATKDQIKASIGGIGQKIKRNSYLRAFAPASTYLQGVPMEYSLQVEPRSYSVGRGMRVQCAPPMVCGTPKGQMVPWLMLWQKNPMSKEQMALFVSMALDVLDQDGELEGADLVVVDTSDKSLDKKGQPKLLFAREMPKLPPQDVREMLEIFAQGFSLAEKEWSERLSANVNMDRNASSDISQLSLDISFD